MIHNIKTFGTSELCRTLFEAKKTKKNIITEKVLLSIFINFFERRQKSKSIEENYRIVLSNFHYVLMLVYERLRILKYLSYDF